MERTVALKKLRKILGNSLGYRVEPDALTQEEREFAQAQCKLLAEAKRRAQEAMIARERAVLEADEQYQQLRAEYKIAKQQLDNMFSASHRYKFTVGTTSGMFFHVKAQGDSWEEVIAKLTPQNPAGD